jgi:hypothetical protein
VLDGALAALRSATDGRVVSVNSSLPSVQRAADAQGR